MLIVAPELRVPPVVRFSDKAGGCPDRGPCYLNPTTKEEIASILDRITEPPHEAHDELIQSVAQIEAKYGGLYRLSEEERAALDRSHEDVRGGRFASPEKIEGVLARHRGR